MTEIREEFPADVPSIRDVNTRAFGRDQEANIVDALRSNGAVLLSLVAVEEEGVVGHVMYSRATIGEVSGAALGPMAVLPERQRQGIGGELVKTGTERLRKAGCPFLIVVGHPAFYPRFGFQPASAHGISCEWRVPDEAFMIIVLDETLMRSVSGRALYRQEFSTAS
jgi:putative acetyltransferase